MTLSLVGTGAWVSGSTTATPTYPGGYTAVAEDLAIVAVATTHATSANIPVAPAGWARELTFLGGHTGGHAVDAGPRRITVFSRILTTGEALGAFTLAAGASAGTTAQVVIYRKTTGAYSVVVASGQDQTVDTTFSAACSSSLSFAAGDECYMPGVVVNDSATYSAWSVTATGMTVSAGTFTQLANSNGDDHKAVSNTATLTAGTATVAPTVTGTLSSSGAVFGVGAALVVRVREMAGVAEAGSTVYATANTATITTASFTPADNTLLVAYCGMGNGAGTASSLGAVTDSLGGSWTRLGGEASVTGGVAEIWARDIATGASMTVTYDPGGAAASGLDITCKWYETAAPLASQPGATAVNGGGTAYSKAITTTTVGSIVAGSLGRANDAQTLVPNASTALIGQFNGSGGDTAGLFRMQGLVETAGSVTLGFTNTAGGANRIVLVEILPAAGASTAVTGVVVGVVVATAVAVKVVAASGRCVATATAVSRKISPTVATVRAVASARVVAVHVTSSTARGVATGVTSSTAVHVGAPTARTVAAGAAYSAATHVATGSTRAVAATTATAAAARKTATSATCAAVASATATARKVYPATGASAGATTARASTVHVVATTARAAAAGVAYSTAKPVATSSARTAAVAATAVSAVRKNAVVGAAVGVAASAASTTSGTARQVVARCAAVGVAQAVASRITAAAATSVAVVSARLVAARRTPATGTTAAAATTQAVAFKRVTATGRVVAVAFATGAGSQLGASRPAVARCVAVAACYSRSHQRTVRPNSGTTSRPNSGTTSRPNSGAAGRPNNGRTPRPDSGVTYRP